MCFVRGEAERIPHLLNAEMRAQLHPVFVTSCGSNLYDSFLCGVHVFATPILWMVCISFKCMAHRQGQALGQFNLTDAEGEEHGWGHMPGKRVAHAPLTTRVRTGDLRVVRHGAKQHICCHCARRKCASVVVRGMLVRAWGDTIAQWPWADVPLVSGRGSKFC